MSQYGWTWLRITMMYTGSLCNAVFGSSCAVQICLREFTKYVGGFDLSQFLQLALVPLRNLVLLKFALLKSV